ncbi:hypothetical protein [Cellulomonas sp.]|uniref:hypothetical protein n=1 Tax=Cellulomonas sp. TaxID=40001 RepID=UPI001B11AB8D|nr:hypothetical protein [Cellulomonas sp.]MBO9555615.1 hypothetical protein [Cellulomonas sp.]
MIGEAYRSRAVQAVLGPSHSELIPAVLWLGWLDGSGGLIAMSGTSVTHEVWGPSGDGVSNVVAIDAGAAGDGWGTLRGVGLFDAAVDGTLVVAAALGAPVTPDEDEALAFEPGALVFVAA